MKKIDFLFPFPSNDSTIKQKGILQNHLEETPIEKNLKNFENCPSSSIPNLKNPNIMKPQLKKKNLKIYKKNCPSSSIPNFKKPQLIKTLKIS